MKYDKEFLTRLCTLSNQTKYVRIIALDQNDLPLESFEGTITEGNAISLDGSSSVRRTCGFTMVVSSEGEKINSPSDPYWGLTSRFKVEIGLLNNIDNKYPDKIWFNQGIFLITSFSCSESANGSYTISISGKDKMAKLNGDMGGVFPTEITLDTKEDVAKDGSVKYEK